jgi:hypothetical protein
MKNILFSFISLLCFQFSTGQNAVDVKYGEIIETISYNDYHSAANMIKELKSLFKTVPPKITYLELIINAAIIQKAPLNDFEFLRETRNMTSKYLKDNIDRQNEAYYKIESIREQLSYYPKDKATFDISKELENQEIEQKIKDSLAILFNKSDLNLISMSIKEEFSGYFQKGEFEKTDAYKERINANGQFVFDSICHKSIIRKIKKIKNNISLDVSKYDADKESYNLSVVINGETFSNSIKVKINNAEKFKNTSTASSFINLPVNENDWRFFKNNLYPSKLFLGEELIEFNLADSTFSPLNFSSKTLGISNEYIQNDFKYDFNNYVIREKARKQLKYNNFILEGDSNVEKGYSIEALKLYKLAAKNLDDEFVQKKIAETTRLIGEYSIFMDEFNKNYTFCSVAIKNKVQLNEETYRKLTEAKKKYGEKYKECFELFNNEINSQWTTIIEKNPINNLKEKEVVYTEDKLMLEKIVELRKEINRFLQFDEIVTQSINTNNIQSLKVLKEDDNKVLIENIISLSPKQ